jgi:hypothetical protein
VACLELLVAAGADDLNLAMLQADCYRHEEAKAWLSERCDKGYLAIMDKKKEDDEHKAKLQERKRLAAERRVVLNAERAVEIGVEKEEKRRERAEAKAEADKQELLRIKWASQQAGRKAKNTYAHSINKMRENEKEKARVLELDRQAAVKEKKLRMRGMDVKKTLEELQYKLEDGLEEWEAREADGKVWSHGIQRREKDETVRKFDERRGRHHWWKDDFATKKAMKNRKELMSIKSDEEAHERRVALPLRLPYAPVQ